MRACLSSHSKQVCFKCKCDVFLATFFLSLLVWCDSDELLKTIRGPLKVIDQAPQNTSSENLHIPYRIHVPTHTLSPAEVKSS